MTPSLGLLAALSLPAAAQFRSVLPAPVTPRPVVAPRLAFPLQAGPILPAALSAPPIAPRPAPPGAAAPAEVPSVHGAAVAAAQEGGARRIEVRLAGLFDGARAPGNGVAEDLPPIETAELPSSLAGSYAVLPGGGVGRRGVDPAARRLRKAGVELWAVRHGETETNRRSLLAGRGTDAPLTPAGAVQAERAAERQYQALGGDDWARRVLAGTDEPVVVLHSPLRRARQTAAAFLALLDRAAARLAPSAARPLHEARTVRGLSEMAYGRYEGLPLARARTLPFWSGWDAYTGPGRDFRARFPGGESRLDVLVRQRRVLAAVSKVYRGRKVVAFSHFETIVGQKAALGLLPLHGDGALRAVAVENAVPVRLSGSSEAETGP